MSKMKELYEKVAADSMLQTEFLKILKEAEETNDKKSVEIKIINFAKDAGYDITLDEMKTFFEELHEPKQGVLSEAELDMVAGGKSQTGQGQTPGEASVYNCPITPGTPTTSLTPSFPLGFSGCPLF